jgi:hypothetical protein
VFEEVQRLRFQVYDMDTSFTSNETKHVNLSQQDFMGECSCALADIVGNRYGEKKMHLSKNGVQKKSEIVITSEELRGQNDLVQVGLARYLCVPFRELLVQYRFSGTTSSFLVRRDFHEWILWASRTLF